MSLNISVIGGGICGLSSAYQLAQQYPHSNISVISDEWHPNTTSDHGFGIVIMIKHGYTDDHVHVKSYLESTIQFCRRLDPKTSESMGIRLVETVVAAGEKDPEASEFVKNIRETSIDLRKATEDEIKSLGFSKKNLLPLFDNNHTEEDVSMYLGHHYVIDTGLYLKWLTKNLRLLKNRDRTNRVQFVHKRLADLNEVETADLIVNCSGLGAKKLANDQFMVPIRGQYVCLEPSSSLNRLLLLNHALIVPRINDVAVGGVYQIGRTDRQIDPVDTEDILQRAEIGFPAIRQAKVRKVDVGIRPGRIGGPRVELEMKKIWNEKSIPVIHNYGHGPRGIAQHYGCALKVCRLAASIFPIQASL